MKNSTTKNKIISSSLVVSSILFCLIIWIILTNIYDNDIIFPNALDILKKFFKILTTKKDLIAILMTISRACIAVVMCLAISLLITALYIKFPISIYFFKPIIKAMRSIPLAIISIFIHLLLGSKIGPYFITFLMTLPVMLEGLITGVNEISQPILDELKMLKITTRVKIKDIYIPITKPYILMALIQSLGMSFKVLIMGEYICQTKNSIGKMLSDLKSGFPDMAGLIAYGLLIIIIVSVLEIFIHILKKQTS